MLPFLRNKSITYVIDLKLWYWWNHRVEPITKSGHERMHQCDGLRSYLWATSHANTNVQAEDFLNNLRSLRKTEIQYKQAFQGLGLVDYN